MKTTNNKRLRAVLLAFLGYFFWGFSFMFSSMAMKTASPFVMLAHRFTLALLGMLVILWLRGERLRFRGKRLGLLLVMGIFEPVLYFIGEAYGILLTNTAFSGVMIATIPLFVLPASALFLKEIPSRAQVIWSLVSIAGVIVVALQGSKDGVVSLAGVLCLLLAVVSSVAFTILTRELSAEFTPFERSFASFAMGAGSFWLLAFWENRWDLGALVRPFAGGEYWLSMLFLACVASVVCYLLLNYALGEAPANQVAIGTNLVTAVSIVAGIVFLHEPFSWVSMLASLVILIGIYGVQRGAPPE